MASNKKTPRVLRAILITAAVLLLAAGALFAVKYISGRVHGVVYPLRFTEELTAAAARYGLDPKLVAAVVYTESGFRESAVSADGAEGLMQILPSTAEWIAFRKGEPSEGIDLFDPATNLDYGCWLLKFLLDRYDGNTRFALIAYNAGHGRLDSWLKDDPTGELNDIPYGETRAYVDKVLRSMDKYGEIYENELGQN
ncbi:MAG: lytic transglycosylase domain-containing protein [Clostridia bacterium]|nr:lytic transglycosylase domain-containing protein [Clostridia bacterium]